MLGTDRHQSSGIFVTYVSSDVITIASTERLFVSYGCSRKQVRSMDIFLQKWRVTKSAATFAVKSWL